MLDILKMCMWVFDGARINFDKITAFETSFWQLFCTIRYNQQLLKFLAWGCFRRKRRGIVIALVSAAAASSAAMSSVSCKNFVITEDIYMKLKSSHVVVHYQKGNPYQ